MWWVYATTTKMFLQKKSDTWYNDRNRFLDVIGNQSAPLSPLTVSCKMFSFNSVNLDCQLQHCQPLNLQLRACRTESTHELLHTVHGPQKQSQPTHLMRPPHTHTRTSVGPPRLRRRHGKLEAQAPAYPYQLRRKRHRGVHGQREGYRR